nr:hypothetical protein [Kibdelosporangium sp. MJ126-NF4]CTQ94921.1 hypothetical protein [Kibdelosporangium sp. MJ126-NF4]
MTIDDDAVELTEFGQAGHRRLLGEPAPGEPIHRSRSH